MVRKATIFCVCWALAGCTALIGGGKKEPRKAGLENAHQGTHIHQAGVVDRKLELDTGSIDGR